MEEDLKNILDQKLMSSVMSERDIDA